MTGHKRAERGTKMQQGMGFPCEFWTKVNMNRNFHSLNPSWQTPSLSLTFRVFSEIFSVAKHKTSTEPAQKSLTY